MRLVSRGDGKNLQVGRNIIRFRP